MRCSFVGGEPEGPLQQRRFVQGSCLECSVEHRDTEPSLGTSFQVLLTFDAAISFADAATLSAASLALSG